MTYTQQHKGTHTENILTLTQGHSHAYTQTHAYTLTHTLTQRNTPIHTYMATSACIVMHKDTFTHIQICIHAKTHIHMHKHSDIETHAH